MSKLVVNSYIYFLYMLISQLLILISVQSTHSIDHGGKREKKWQSSAL